MFICCSLYSCSEDDDGGYSRLDNQENLVEIKVSSNTPDAPIALEGVKGGYLTVKETWETKYLTKEWGVGFTVRCNDKAVLMIGEICINGKLTQRVEANSTLHMFVKIK